MSDRELLELAAKAAGIELRWERDAHYIQERWVAYIPCGWVGQPSEREWNPLRESGDALDLAVKLGMEVYVDTHPNGCECAEAQSHTYSTPGNAMRSVVNHGSDAYAATRRAIVVAAAEIGRTK